MNTDSTTTTAVSATRPSECLWCGLPGCPDAFEHRRLYAGSETTWREQSRPVAWTKGGAA